MKKEKKIINSSQNALRTLPYAQKERACHLESVHRFNRHYDNKLKQYNFAMYRQIKK